MKKIICLLLAALLASARVLATPSYSVTITGLNAKGTTVIGLVAAQATLLPTPLPTQQGTIHQNGSGTTPDEYYYYTGLNTGSDKVTISPGLLTTKFRNGTYLFQVWTPVVTATATTTPTNSPTNTPSATPTPTQTVSLTNVSNMVVTNNVFLSGLWSWFNKNVQPTITVTATPMPSPNAGL